MASIKSHKDIVLAFFEQHIDTLTKDEMRDLLYIIFPRGRDHYTHTITGHFNVMKLGNYMVELLTAQGTLGLIVLQDIRPFLGACLDLLVKKAGHVYDELYSFVIDRATNTLICPDDSRKEMIEEVYRPDEPEWKELYAEYRDIGIWYYPNGRSPATGNNKPSFWVQGQTPTYRGETLNGQDVCVSFL